MSKELLKRLENYRVANKLSKLMLSRELTIPENYLYRWIKKGYIKGIYYKVLDEYLVSKGFQGF